VVALRVESVVVCPVTTTCSSCSTSRSRVTFTSVWPAASGTCRCWKPMRRTRSEVTLAGIDRAKRPWASVTVPTVDPSTCTVADCTGALSPDDRTDAGHPALRLHLARHGRDGDGGREQHPKISHDSSYR
jgi:hypothetical protein